MANASTLENAKAATIGRLEARNRKARRSNPGNPNRVEADEEAVYNVPRNLIAELDNKCRMDLYETLKFEGLERYVLTHKDMIGFIANGIPSTFRRSQHGQPAIERTYKPILLRVVDETEQAHYRDTVIAIVNGAFKVPKDDGSFGNLPTEVDSIAVRLCAPFGFMIRKDYQTGHLFVS